MAVRVSGPSKKSIRVSMLSSIYASIASLPEGFEARFAKIVTA